MKPDQMNDKKLRIINKNLKSQNKRWPKDPVIIPKDQWPDYRHSSQLTAVWRSRDFLIQVFDEPDGIIRISANRTMLNAFGDWRSNISWDELQWIKDQIGFADKFAVEIFPARSHLINVANMRHLWILPEPPKYGWRSSLCQE